MAILTYIFYEIDLKIDSKSFIILIDFLKKNKVIEKLSFTNIEKKFTNEEIHLFASMLKKKENLFSLKFSNCNLDDYQLEILLEGIQNNLKIYHLDLSSKIIKFIKKNLKREFVYRCWITKIIKFYS